MCFKSQKKHLIDCLLSCSTKSKNTKKKLFSIRCQFYFFSVVNRIPEAGGIETRFKIWQKYYESSYGVRFYKCIIHDYEQVMRMHFKIKDTPTLVFIRNGAEIQKSRLDDLNESNPNQVHQAEVNGETADEKRVKDMLNELCQKNG